MKRFFSLMLTVVMVLALAACGNSAPAEPASESEADMSAAQNTETEQSSSSGETTQDEKQSEETGNPKEAGNLEQADNTAQAERTEGGSNMLVAYFSLAGEQYGVGVVEEGNTSVIAHMIAEQTGADLFEIEAANPYPTTYDGLLDVSQQEMKENARPEIAGTVENMDDYDTIFVGYPNWWGDMPMIVYSFLENYNLSGKTIVPFCTHGGSGLSGTEQAIEDVTGGVVMAGLAIAGTTAQNDRDTARSEVLEWLREGGFVE